MQKILLSLAFFSLQIFSLELSPGLSNASVYFISPLNNQVVENKFVVKFGLKDFGVAPAGIALDGTGHHHLIIDSKLPVFNLPIPADKNHVHFGNGQTETQVVLTPGVHTLQLLLGDYRHIPHDPPIFSKRISVNVQSN